MSFFYESAPDHKDYHLMKHKSAHPALLHFHAAYELLIVESGERTVRMGNKVFTLTAGEGCFVDAFCPHSFETHAVGTEIFVFVGNGTLFAPILHYIARINHAMLLISDGASATEAAFASGFTSMPSFHRAFRAHTGTPEKG